MFPYILLFVLVIGLYPILYKKNLGLYCTIISIFLILLVGFRDYEMGSRDTIHVYQPGFVNILNNNFLYLFQLKDFGFQLYTFLFTRVFGDNFTLYLIVSSIPYIAIVSFFIYKYGKVHSVSYLFFICMWYYGQSFTMIRHCDALAFVILGMHFLIEEKNWNFLLSIICASLFHQTALIFLLIYPFKNVILRKNHLLVATIILTIFFVFGENITDIFLGLFEGTRYDIYVAGDITEPNTITYFILNLLFIFIIVLLDYRNISKNNQYKIMFYSCLICLILSPLTMVFNEFTRLSYFFGFPLMVLVPNVIMRFYRKEDKTIISSLMSIVLILYFIFFNGPNAGILPYKFVFELF